MKRSPSPPGSVGRDGSADPRDLDEAARNYHTAGLSQSYIIIQNTISYRVKQSVWSVLYRPVVGSFFVRIDNGSAYEVEAGACLAIPSGRGHLISGQAAFPGPAKPAESLKQIRKAPAEKSARRDGDLGSRSSVVFRLRSPNTNNSLLEALPPAMKLTKREVEALPDLATTFERLQGNIEDDDPFLEMINWRYADIIALSILSDTLKKTPFPADEVLKGRYDPNIRRAIKAIHEDLSRPWSVDALAEAVNLSRASFASRFRTAVGETPMEYVTAQRMNLAKRFLETQNWPIGAIADEVGYKSQAAFINAFRRVVGLSPGEYRRKARGAQS